MVGSAQYTDREIRWILESIVSRAKSASIQKNFENQFGRTLNHNQVRYVKNKYGKDPRFNSPLVNTRPMKTVGVATNSAPSQWRKDNAVHRTSPTKRNVIDNGSATPVSPPSTVPKRRRDVDEEECYPNRPLQQRTKSQYFGSRAPTPLGSTSNSMGLVSGLMPPPPWNTPSIRLSDTFPRHFSTAVSPGNSTYKEIENTTGGFSQYPYLQQSTYAPSPLFMEVDSVTGQPTQSLSFQQLTHVPTTNFKDVNDVTGPLGCSPNTQESTQPGNFRLPDLDGFLPYTFQQYSTTLDFSQPMYNPATDVSPYFGLSPQFIQQNQVLGLQVLDRHVSPAYSPHQHGISSPNGMSHDMQFQSFLPPQQSNDNYNNLYQLIHPTTYNTLQAGNQHPESTDLSDLCHPDPFEAPPTESFPQIRPDTVSDIIHTGITAYNALDVEKALYQAQLAQGNQGTMPRQEATKTKNVPDEMSVVSPGDLDIPTPVITRFPDDLRKVNPLVPSKPLSNSPPRSTTVDPKLL